MAGRKKAGAMIWGGGGFGKKFKKGFSEVGMFALKIQPEFVIVF